MGADESKAICPVVERSKAIPPPCDCRLQLKISAKRFESDCP
jgi:hypothetical protein